MRKRALILCLTLLAAAVAWSPGFAGAQEAPSCPRDLVTAAETDVTSLFQNPENAPVKRSGCYISCNTDFNVSCTGSTFRSCFDGLDANGYYISCNGVRYYCPPCPSWNPEHCLD